MVLNLKFVSLKKVNAKLKGKCFEIRYYSYTNRHLPFPRLISEIRLFKRG